MLSNIRGPVFLAYCFAFTSSIAALASWAAYGYFLTPFILAPYFLILAIADTSASISNLGLSQFVQKNVAASECRGRSLILSAMLLRVAASAACAFLGLIYLVYYSERPITGVSVVIEILILIVLGGISRLGADFLEADHAPVVAQLVRNCAGYLRLASIGIVLYVGYSPRLQDLLLVEIMAASVSLVIGYSVLSKRWRGMEAAKSFLRLSVKEMSAYAANDWVFSLQTAGVVRMCAARFLGDGALTALSLAQSIIGPVARYAPSILLRGVWMSRAARAQLQGDAARKSVLARANVLNMYYFLLVLIPVIAGGSYYLGSVTDQSLSLNAALSALIALGGAALAVRVVNEIELQVMNMAGHVVLASGLGTAAALAVAFAFRSELLIWASVPLIACVVWGIISRAIYRVKFGGVVRRV